MHPRDEMRGADATCGLEQHSRPCSPGKSVEGALDERFREHRDHVGSGDTACELLKGVGLLALAELIDERISQRCGERLGIDLGWFRLRDARLLTDAIERFWREVIASETP